VSAKVLVNSTGPWVSEFLNNNVHIGNTEQVRLVKGSHIVVPKLFDHDRVYLFQNPDNRIIFAIPYERDFTLIGTTDIDVHGDLTPPEISAEEIDYLCHAASEYFKAPIRAADVIWSYSGIRPLYDDGASTAREATRDYVLSFKPGNTGHPPLLSVFGGKITTHRKLAEAVLKKLTGALPAMNAAWTGHQPLPGGDFSIRGFAALCDRAVQAYPFLQPATLQRMVHAYGTRIDEVLANVRQLEDMGEHFGVDLYAREVDWLIRNEWAMSGEDVLWRRTKLGLRLSQDQCDAVAGWMAGHELLKLSA